MAKVKLKITWHGYDDMRYTESAAIELSEELTKREIQRNIEMAMSQPKSLQVDLANGNSAVLGPEVVRNSVFEFIDIDD